MRSRKYLNFLGDGELSRVSVGIKPYIQGTQRTQNRTSTKIQSMRQKIYHAKAYHIAEDQMQYIISVQNACKHFCH